MTIKKTKHYREFRWRLKVKNALSLLVFFEFIFSHFKMTKKLEKKYWNLFFPQHFFVLFEKYHKKIIRLREAINIKLVKRNASLFIRYFLRDIFTARNITHRLSIRDLKRASQSHKTMLCARVRHRRKTHKFNSGMEQKKETERYKWCCDGSSLKKCTFFYSQYIYFYLINFHLFSYFFIPWLGMSPAVTITKRSTKFTLTKKN